MINSNKSEICSFMVNYRLELLLKIKLSLFFLQESNLLSNKSSMLKIKDFLSLWLDKMWRWKSKELKKDKSKEVISFATISIIVKKHLNSKLLLMFWNYPKTKKLSLLDMNVFFTCMQLLNKYKSSRFKLNTIQLLRKMYQPHS